MILLRHWRIALLGGVVAYATIMTFLYIIQKNDIVNERLAQEAYKSELIAERDELKKRLIDEANSKKIAISTAKFNTSKLCKQTTPNPEPGPSAQGGTLPNSDSSGVRGPDTAITRELEEALERCQLISQQCYNLIQDVKGYQQFTNERN